MFVILLITLQVMLAIVPYIHKHENICVKIGSEVIWERKNQMGVMLLPCKM